MNAKALIVATIALWPWTLAAQGFAGLGQASEGYALPDPETRFAFPEDHGAHRAFRIEWWYVTANLQGEDGKDYGIQWTLFRNALSPGQADSDQAWMGHAAVSTPEGHHFAERLARGDSGLAGVRAIPFDAYIDEWRMAGPSLASVDLTAGGTDFRYDLALSANGPFVAQGAHGFSVKSAAGQASHYYSQPFYTVSGSLALPGKSVEVSGVAWLDREWSSQPLTADQTGWDWVSLHLDGGDKLMGYRLRDKDGSAYTVGTWITAAGIPQPLQPGDLDMTALKTTTVEGRDVPVHWRVELPARALSVEVKALYADSWMGTRIPYWEGPVSVDGTHDGIGYLEMSGY